VTREKEGKGRRGGEEGRKGREWKGTAHPQVFKSRRNDNEMTNEQNDDDDDDEMQRTERSHVHDCYTSRTSHVTLKCNRNKIIRRHP